MRIFMMMSIDSDHKNYIADDVNETIQKTMVIIAIRMTIPIIAMTRYKRQE